MHRWWLLGSCIAVGCYAPQLREGVPCAEDGSCPRGQMCLGAETGQGTCWSIPALPDAPEGFDGADDPAAPVVAHLALADRAQLRGMGDLTIADTTQLDTTTLGTKPALPSGIHLFVAMQPGGGEVAVLDVHDLLIDHRLMITGTRPLIIVASGSVTIAARVTAGADQDVPGPGGFGPGLGPNAGGGGAEVVQDDSGGGGAGGSTPGGAGGGSGIAPGGAGGPAATDDLVSLLVGGSGGGTALGGAAAPCGTGGVGGGALQITATTINVDDDVNVGGGGGQGGGPCNGNYGGGGGGGAGGALYLEASLVQGEGHLSANGGGGGEGGDLIAGGGASGDDGGRSGSASGGALLNNPGGDGGAGGATGAPGGGGGTPGSTSNGGGGGGAGGRIYLDIPPAAALTFECSPTCQRRMEP